MAKTIKHETLTSTLELSEATDGFWLWDSTRGMNLAMKSKTERAAFVEALEYYQDRLRRVEGEHHELSNKVNKFVSQITEHEE